MSYHLLSVQGALSIIYLLSASSPPSTLLLWYFPSPTGFSISHVTTEKLSRAPLSFETPLSLCLLRAQLTLTLSVNPLLSQCGPCLCHTAPSQQKGESRHRGMCHCSHCLMSRPHDTFCPQTGTLSYLFPPTRPALSVLCQPLPSTQPLHVGAFQVIL